MHPVPELRVGDRLLELEALCILLPDLKPRRLLARFGRSEHEQRREQDRIPWPAPLRSGAHVPRDRRFHLVLELQEVLLKQPAMVLPAVAVLRELELSTASRLRVGLHVVRHPVAIPVHELRDLHHRRLPLDLRCTQATESHAFWRTGPDAEPALHAGLQPSLLSAPFCTASRMGAPGKRESRERAAHPGPRGSGPGPH